MLLNRFATFQTWYFPSHVSGYFSDFWQININSNFLKQIYFAILQEALDVKFEHFLKCTWVNVSL